MSLGRFFLALVLLTLCAPAHAAEDRLRQLEQQMDEKQRQQQRLDEAAQNAAKNLDDLRDRLIRSTQQLQDKETEEDNLEDRLDDLTGEIAEKSKNAAQERARLSQMVSALIEIASRPPESLFLQDGTTSDHVHRSLLLHAVLPGLAEEAESSAHDLAALYDLQTQLAEQKRLIAAAQQNLQKQRGDLDQLIAARQGFLQRTESQKADIASHLEQLSAQAKDLRQLMQKVSLPQPPKSPRAAGNDMVALHWPVSGAIKRRFGEKDSDGVTSEGLTLTAPSGAPIVAPRAGKVVFAGPFRGYGQIMILQHPGGYHSFLAGFGRIDVELGQEIAAGEPLGVLPVRTGSRPELYFEWRRNEEPTDPIGGLGGHS